MSELRFQSVPHDRTLAELIAQVPALALWFSGPDCGVCANLKPKLEALFTAEFPRFCLVEVPCADHPQLAAGQLVFSVPTLILFFDGRESLRLTRNFSLDELRSHVQRVYGLLFG